MQDKQTLQSDGKMKKKMNHLKEMFPNSKLTDAVLENSIRQRGTAATADLVLSGEIQTTSWKKVEKKNKEPIKKEKHIEKNEHQGGGRGKRFFKRPQEQQHVEKNVEQVQGGGSVKMFVCLSPSKTTGSYAEVAKFSQERTKERTVVPSPKNEQKTLKPKESSVDINTFEIKEETRFSPSPDNSSEWSKQANPAEVRSLLEFSDEENIQKASTKNFATNLLNPKPSEMHSGFYLETQKQMQKKKKKAVKKSIESVNLPSYLQEHCNSGYSFGVPTFGYTEEHTNETQQPFAWDQFTIQHSDSSLTKSASASPNKEAHTCQNIDKQRPDIAKQCSEETPFVTIPINTSITQQTKSWTTPSDHIATPNMSSNEQLAMQYGQFTGSEPGYEALGSFSNKIPQTPPPTQSTFLHTSQGDPKNQGKGLYSSPAQQLTQSQHILGQMPYMVPHMYGYGMYGMQQIPPRGYDMDYASTGFDPKYVGYGYGYPQYPPIPYNPGVRHGWAPPNGFQSPTETGYSRYNQKSNSAARGSGQKYQQHHN